MYTIAIHRCRYVSTMYAHRTSTSCYCSWLYFALLVPNASVCQEVTVRWPQMSICMQILVCHTAAYIVLTSTHIFRRYVRTM